MQDAQPSTSNGAQPPQSTYTSEGEEQQAPPEKSAEQKQADRDLIDEAKKYLDLVISTEGDNREESLTDLRYLAGEQWDAQDLRNRKLDRRPALTINKLPTFLHQVTNDQRMNVPSIKVSPVDSVADPKIATLIQGLIRHIEYASNADVAYDTAVASAAAIGFGVFRIVTDFCSEDSFDQDIRFKRVRNPFTVYMDPFSEEPDGSDQKRCMISGKMDHDSFKQMYPGAEVTTEGFSWGAGDQSMLNWIGEDFVRIAEYYRIEREEAVLLELSNGEVGFKDKLIQMPPGVGVKRERKTTRNRTMLYTITALEVLDVTEIKCPWIPVFPVYGDEIDIDGEVVRSGIIRNARDPQQMYNFWMTSATEEVALRSKTPYIGAEGQFEGYEDDWEAANNKAFPFLEYKQVALDGQLAPPPQRQPMTDVPQGVLTMAMHANDNIKATTGLFDSSLGARGSATSGVQERQQQRQGNIANFHFTDNLNRTLRHAGRCLIKMIRYYYDGTRIVRIMGDDREMSSEQVNQPIPPEQQKPDAQTGVIQTVLNDLTVGEYDVVVSTGPAYSTLRQEAVDSMVQLGSKWPKLMDVAGDKVVRAMDWPGAAEIADRIERTIPPEVRTDPNAEQDPTAPVVKTPRGDIPVDQAAMMIQHMDKQIQDMGQQLQEAQSGITKAKIDASSALEKAKIEAEGREKVAEINAVAKGDVAELTGMVQLLIARIPPPPLLANDVARDLQDDDPAAAQGAPSASLPARRRRISIQAPSGAMYEGMIHDEEAPPPPDAAPPDDGSAQPQAAPDQPPMPEAAAPQ